MSCGGNNNYGVLPSVQASGECITDIVKNIVKAQHRAVEAEEDTCYTSCDRSVADLLSDFEPNRRRIRHNTIPFILYCKDSCKAFTGSGYHRRRGKFHCVESPIFRAKNFVRGSNHCVMLELLLPVGGSGDHTDADGSCCSSGLCKHYGNHFDNFRATGICITVDLRCFCGISCLDPVTPIPYNLAGKDC